MIEYKNLLVLIILEILMKYTDKHNTLTQKEIVDIIRRDYQMEVERKSIKRNIDALMSLGIDIRYTPYTKTYCDRITGLSEEREFYTDFYLEHTFTDSELKVLVDGVWFSKYLSGSHKKILISKLGSLSNKNFKASSTYIRSVSSSQSQRDLNWNYEIFSILEKLEGAIKQNRKISFNYRHYGIDKKLHDRKENGKSKVYIINPYNIVAANGRYYLICNNDKYDNISNYRIDRIANIEILESKRKPLKSLNGCENGFDLSQYISKHIYMYNSEDIVAKINIDRSLLSESIDIFGDNISFVKECEDIIESRIKGDRYSIKQWTLQYGPKVKVLYPQELVDEIKFDIKKVAEMYDI